MAFRDRPRSMNRSLASVIKHRVGVALVVGLALVAAACGDAQTGSRVPVDPTGTSNDPSWGPLAVVPPDDGSELAGIAGILRVTDGCVLLDERGDDVLLVWPADRTKWAAESGTVSFELSDGRTVTLADGDEVAFGGGGSSVDEDGIAVEDWVADISWVSAPRASCLTDTRWFVNDLIEAQVPESGSERHPVQAAWENLRLSLPRVSW